MKISGLALAVAMVAGPSVNAAPSHAKFDIADVSCHDGDDPTCAAFSETGTIASVTRGQHGLPSSFRLRLETGRFVTENVDPDDGRLEGSEAARFAHWVQPGKRVAVYGSVSGSAQLRSVGRIVAL